MLLYEARFNCSGAIHRFAELLRAIMLLFTLMKLIKRCTFGKNSFAA